MRTGMLVMTIAAVAVAQSARAQTTGWSAGVGAVATLDATRSDSKIRPGLSVDVGNRFNDHWRIAFQLELPSWDTNLNDSTFPVSSYYPVRNAVTARGHSEDGHRLPTFTVLFARRLRAGAVQPAILFGGSIGARQWKHVGRTEYLSGSGEVVRRDVGESSYDSRVLLAPVGMEVAVPISSRWAIVPYSTISIVIPPLVDYGSPWTWRAGVLTRVALNPR